MGPSTAPCGAGFPLGRAMCPVCGCTTTPLLPQTGALTGGCPEASYLPSSPLSCRGHGLSPRHTSLLPRRPGSHPHPLTPRLEHRSWASTHSVSVGTDLLHLEALGTVALGHLPVHLGEEQRPEEFTSQQLPSYSVPVPPSPASQAGCPASLHREASVPARLPLPGEASSQPPSAAHPGLLAALSWLPAAAAHPSVPGPRPRPLCQLIHLHLHPLHTLSG